MEVGRLSSLYTISFTEPRLDPTRDGDFCVYFALETIGAETLVSDLALFIQALGRNLIRWSVLGNPHRLGPDNPAHPVLRDLTYCWDGVVCAHGVLQFGATSVSVMNIRWVFHRTSQICGPFCHAHRYEYFANGIFSDVERAVIPQVFTEMEVAAQYVHSNQFLPIFKLLTCNSALGSFATTMPFSLVTQMAPNAFRTKAEVRFFFVLEIPTFHVCQQLNLFFSLTHAMVTLHAH